MWKSTWKMWITSSRRLLDKKLCRFIWNCNLPKKHRNLSEMKDFWQKTIGNFSGVFLLFSTDFLKTRVNTAKQTKELWRKTCNNTICNFYNNQKTETRRFFIDSSRSVCYNTLRLSVVEMLEVPFDASVAQSVEQLIRNQQVRCSSHPTSSTKRPENDRFRGVLLCKKFLVWDGG